MNSVHFIQDPNPSEGQNIQCASAQPSPALLCMCHLSPAEANVVSTENPGMAAKYLC